MHLLLQDLFFIFLHSEMVFLSTGYIVNNFVGYMERYLSTYIHLTLQPDY